VTVFPTFGTEGRWHYRRSLASRVTLLTTMAVGLSVAIVALGAFITVRMQLQSSLDDTLVQRAEAASSGIDQINTSTDVPASTFPAAAGPQHGTLGSKL